MTTTRFVTLSIATITSPDASSGSLPSMSHLVGIGLLTAERDGEERWRFDLSSHAIGAGDGEDALLAWATYTLPDDNILLGWRLADAVLPPLLDAASQGNAETGRAFLDRLAKLVTGLSVDLAVPHGGAGALPFTDVVATLGITADMMTTAAIESVWSFGETAGVREHLEAEAIALWQLWLLEGNGRAATAGEAFAAWLEERSRRSS